MALMKSVYTRLGEGECLTDALAESPGEICVSADPPRVTKCGTRVDTPVRGEPAVMRNSHFYRYATSK